ncbi:MAG: gliding motility-associated C-terminal domain-containing protein, partial [Flavobacteriales bacterium]|nr:gliding motility-associated C-terminal domain-containing protein [Flavobacteriales bacterium]
TALLNSYTICAGSTILLTAEPSPTYSTWLWKKGTATVSTTNTATLGAGTYTITFTNASGCPFTKTITILESPKPVWKLNLFSGVKCDENFDGQIDVNLNDITPVIIGNSSLFTVHYYLTQNDANVGNNNYIQNPATWSYTTNTTIWVRAFSQYCPGEVKQLDFKKGNDIPVSKTEDSVTECDNADNNEDGIKTVNLGSYISNFTALSGVTATYYDNLNAAQNSGTVIPNPVSVNQSGVYYLRLHKANYCDVIVKLNVTIQIPKKSIVLKDKAICPGTITQLDAGPGFDSYLWSTGETTQTIDVPVGNYWVDLTFNGCTFRQHVTVSSVPMPTITGVEIMGTTVTVNVSGGNPPYQYAIDNGNYQSSNVFHNVRGGDHTIYVISSDNCAPVSYEITVVEPYNVITPNADGINDVLNYSALLKKDAPFMQIFDRYGKIVFVGDKNNRYTWDGRAFGKAVPTGSYWLVMHWTEPGVATPSQYSGWVLVKNRD